MLRSPLRPLLRPLMQGLVGPGPYTLVQKAIAILRKYGTNAHVYLLGVGTVSGITAGNYLDSAGVTAASVDNPVGLSLDALQAMTLGSELVTNGVNPTNTTGWIIWGLTAAAVSGEFQITRTGVGQGFACAFPTVVGNRYFVTHTYRNVAVAGGYYVGSAVGLNDIVTSTNLSSATNANNYFSFVAVGTTTYLQFYCQLNGTFAINNVSIKQIPGIHATQSTTSAKPILRRGLLNLLTYSGDFSNAAWVKGLAAVSGSTITATAGAGNHYVQQAKISAATVGSPVTLCFIVQQGTSRYVLIGEDGDASLHVSIFDFNTSTFGTSTNCTPSAISIGGGQWLISVTYSRTNAGNIYPTVIPVLTSSATNFSYTSAGTETVIALSGALFQGTLTAQQIIDAGGIPVTTTAAASNPSAGKYSWQFDGSNDSLSLSAPLFQMSDDHAVIVGANCTASNWRVIVSPSYFDPVNLVATIGFEDITGKAFIQWRGSVNILHKTAGSVVGQSVVLSCKQSTGNRISRMNGVQFAADSAAITATASTAASIGRDANLSSYFQGSIYPVIAIKGAVTDSDLLTLERFVGQLSGVSL